MVELAEQANRNRPVLVPCAPYGRWLDDVVFHPAYHALLRCATRHQVYNFSWQHAPRTGAHVVRAALFYRHYQADAGTACPPCGKQHLRWPRSGANSCCSPITTRARLLLRKKLRSPLAWA